MNREYLHHLIGFHYWARNRVMAAVEPLSSEQYGQQLGSSFSSIRDTLNHVYLAEWIWYSRWNGESPTAFPAIDLPDLATLRARWSQMEGQVRPFLANADLNRVYDYKLMSGKAGSSPLWQMVAHVVNHATYHRGQVTTMLRQLAAAPPESTDMITYFRETSA